MLERAIPEPSGDDALGEERHGHVAVLVLRRPPNNHVDRAQVLRLAERLEALDGDRDCRAVVLAADGRHFCAGADFSRGESGGLDSPPDRPGRTLYREAARLMRTRKPIVAAVQGAAIGAGLGLAAVADFRVGCAEARFSANFTRLGFHPGFGLSANLPRLVGPQRAAMMIFTGERIGGERAAEIGLLDRLVPRDAVRDAAMALAAEIALSAPAAVQGARETLRRGWAEAFDAATEREFEQQGWQRRMADFDEGRRAMAERRPPRFEGR